MQQAEILPADMKVLMNHIYELKKGVRNMVLFTFNKRYETYARTRLEHSGISYITKVSHLPFYRLSRIIKHCNILIDNLLTSRK